ncbi:MAG: S9 family peptidase, partial [Chitinophagaceae bacterium]
RENNEVLNYLKAENSYTDSMLSGTKDLQQNLFNEMKSRIREKDETVPFFKNGYWYYTRYEEGAQYALYCRKKETLTAPEEIILDQIRMAADLKYFKVGAYSISDDNRLVAYTTDVVSRRLFSLHVKDLVTGVEYSESVPNIDGGSIAWAADNKTVFYLLKDTVTLLEYKLMSHVIGTPVSEDKTHFEEKDNRFTLSLSRSKSKKYIFFSSHINELTTEYRYVDAKTPAAPFRVFQQREEGLQYEVEHNGDSFFILTNWKAPNNKLMVTKENATEKINWKELIPGSDSVYLNTMEVFDKFLVISENRNALSELRVISLADMTEHYISFDEKAYSAGIGVNPEFNSQTLRFSYTSMTTPASVYDYDLVKRSRELKKQTAVLGSFKQENYEADRLWATGRDGTKIPVTIVYKKGLKKDGKAPLLLYAYGSYGFSMSPGFSSNNLSLLDRGFVYAIAHVRGGMELGRAWYDNGRMQNKKNTFYDFIDCAEFLLKENFTSKEHLYAMGGSAGGLLMGAIINYRPDLWKGVIAQVPFVDVITTMSDSTIPLTTLEYKEWGNPNDSAEYTYMKSYSPYDNVEKKEYPNLLVTTGLNDSQVQYFEPAKWVAKLRSTKTGDQKLLFKIEMDYGHGGASGRFDYLKEKALEFAFLFALEGITQ